MTPTPSTRSAGSDAAVDGIRSAGSEGAEAPTISESVTLHPPYPAYWRQVLTDVIYDAIHHPPGGPKNVPSGQIAEAVVERLLRAAPPSAPDPEPDLETALDALDAAMDPDHPEGCGCALCNAITDVRMVLEGRLVRQFYRAAPDPEGLPSVDVERLARAMHDDFHHPPWDHEFGAGCVDGEADAEAWRRKARGIIAILVRLSPVEPTDKGDRR